MFKQTLVAAGIAVILSTVGAQAGVIFSDNFNAETQGLNYTGFANWKVTAGSVDLIGTGFFDFYPGHGNYVDMDGTTPGSFPASTMTSNSSFGPGTYTLSFLLGGSQRGDSNNVLITLGDFGVVTGRQSSDPLTPYSLTFTTTIAGNLTFGGEGVADNLGLILDDVVLQDSTTPVPEPLTLSLFGAGAAGVVAIRRRKKAMAA